MEQNNTYNRIKNKLQKFNPTILELEDQSKMHGAGKLAGTHFKLLLVSNYFTNKTKLQRQREVFKELKEEFENGLHALSQKILDEKEYKNSTPHKTVDCIKRKNT